jgi:glycosyltransferase involved in cell wall biosynthesis
LLNNPFLTDSRSWKMAETLGGAGYRVTVVARAEQGLPLRASQDAFEIVRVAQPTPHWLPVPRLPAGEEVPGQRIRHVRSTITETVGRAAQALRYLRLTRLWAADIARAVPWADVWQAEELVTLPVALALRGQRGGLAIYDARDLDVQSARFARLPAPWRRMLERRERAWARAADALIVASAPYGEVIERSVGRKPVVVWNGPPDFEPPDPPEPRWHERLGLAPGTRVVLYLGLAIPGRGIPELCQAIGSVPNAALVVAGFGSEYERYRDEAAALPHASRIHFPGGVAPADILPLTGAADVSAMPVQGDTLNHRLNTPTKLFDAMGAGVPVVASDLPGMAPIIRETRCGELCDPSDPADIARAILAILDAPPDRRAAYREACLLAARDTYSWERQSRTLLDLYAGLPAIP